ncbi:MAG: HlyD family efflux transporter periplasmic adaptor subunit [Kouleothrix sp.]|nr:HlyD family efflux transporter periplasmic adaptor subunit [Kouleothrix sp.]
MQTTVPFPQAHGRAGAQRPRRPWLRWLIVPVVVAIIAGAGLWWRASQTTTTTTSTAAVTQGDLAVTVSGSGTVAAARTVDVPFAQAGTVTSVEVAVGDTVSAGQTLATIDASDLQLQLKQAQANLTAAEAKLAVAKGGSATAADIASAQANLASAQANLTKTKTSSVTDVQSAQANLASAQAKLDALTSPSQADLSADQRAVDQAQLALQSTRNSASQAKTNADLAFQNAVNALTQSQSKYTVALNNWQHVQDTGTDPINPTTTDSTGKKKQNYLNDAQRQQYADAYIQAKAQLDSAQNAVTQAQVSYDTARASEATQVTQAEAAVADAQAQLDALKSPSASDLASARAAVTQAKASLTILQQGGTAASVTSAQAAVTQAQANLDSLTAPASDSDLASAQAALTQAQVAFDTAQTNLAQATLTAPFAGIVSAVSIVPDSTIGAGTSAVTLVDQSKLHVALSLSETDAAKVKVGQPVSLTFDALPDATIAGTVATIAPVATTEQNVVTYAAQITFDPGDTSVKVGMSTTADIQIDQVTGALLVPTRAIQTSGSTKTVTVQQGSAQVTIPVTTGLASNGKTAIVSSGGNGVAALKAGDVVMIPSTSASTSTSTTTSQSSRSSGISSLTGGAGGPPPGP